MILASFSRFIHAKVSATFISIRAFVTAICVMKMQELKLLGIDERVNEYLHQWKFLTTDGEESDSTVRAILSHTAGGKDCEESFYGLRIGDPDVSLLEDSFELVNEWEWVSSVDVKPIEVIEINVKDYMNTITFSEEAKKIQEEIYG